MADSYENKRIVHSILGFLEEELHKDTTTADSKESIEVALQCLETAFGVTSRNLGFKAPKTLREMFSGVVGGAGGAGGAVGAGGAGGAGAGAGGASNPLGQLTDFLRDALTRKDPPAGPSSYDPAGPGDIAVNVGDDYPIPPPAPAAAREKASGFKTEGNKAMENSNFAEALALYTKAIDLDKGNAIYFCNRAAAYLKLNEPRKAVRDCEIACQLDNNYSRAFCRLGVGHSTLGNHRQAIQCYRRAVDLEPENQSYINNLRVAEAEARADSTSTSAPASASGPAADGTPAMASLQNIFNNPNLVSMATQMLQDPNMQQMMQSIMGGINPQAQGTAPSSLQNNFEGLMQMGQVLAEQLEPGNRGGGDADRPGSGSDKKPPSNDNNSGS